MAENQVKVSITADSSGLDAGLAKALGGVKSASQEMASHMGGLQTAFKGLLAPLAALGAGAFLKKAVDETKTWTMEAQKLSRVLGITTESASVLNMALGDNYITLEEYQGGIGKLTKNLGKNEEAFKNLGVSTRDSNGHFRSMPAIMADVNTALGNIKAGTDRNVAAQSVYGKSWAESLKLMKLTADSMEEARIKAERLGMIVGGDAVEATARYRASLNDLEDVTKALTIRIGTELMPVLSALNEDMAETGPLAVDALGGAFTGFYQIIFLGREYLEKFISVLRQQWAEMVLGYETAWKMMKAVANGNGAGILQIYKDHEAKRKDLAKSYADERLDIEETYARKVAQLMGLGPKKKVKKEEDGESKKHFDNPAAQQKMLSDLAFQAELETKIAGAMAAHTLEEQKLRKEEQETAKFHAEEAKINARKDVTEEQRAQLLAANRRAHLSEMGNIEAEFNQKIRDERDKTFAEAGKAVQELGKITDDINKGTRQITQETLERNGPALQGWMAGLKGVLAEGQSAFQMFRQSAHQVMQGVESAFAQGIAGVMSGQLSLAQGMKQIWKGIVSAVIQAVAQMIAQWIVMGIVKKALGVSQAATDGGRTAGALTTATAETWAAYAGIPFVGPALAGAQIALMYASMAGSVAASQGIGAGVSATARATGGLISRPELTLMGEAGPEVIAPESSFHDYTRKIYAMGSALSGNLSANRAAVQGYQTQASGYASLASRSASEGGMGATFGDGAFKGLFDGAHFFDTSRVGMAKAADYFHEAMYQRGNSRAGRLESGRTFGGGA